MIIAPNFFHIKIYKTDKNLNLILSKCCDSGIQSYKDINRYYASVIFNNGIKYIFWNANQWHAWLSEGCIDDYTYSSVMPSYKTMRKFRRELIKLFENKYK